ncbi:MAG: hypothetical protein J6A15_00370, partial [Clostridia bacterium]|nr:hypothetical protein [Clostridia bacterium]
MKKIKIFTIIAMAFLMICCMKSNSNIVHAVNKESQNPSSYNIDADYAFRIRYGSETSVQVYPANGWYVDENDHYRLNSGYWSKGNVWARYNNIGIYNGRAIDIKVVYADWNNPLRLAFERTGIGGGYAKWTENNFNAGKYLDIRVEFYYHDTGEAAYIKGHEIVYDLDYFERWGAKSNITKIIKDSHQSYIDVDANTIGINTGGTGANDGGSFAFLYEGTSYTYRWQGCYYQLGLQPLFKIEVPNPTKAVSTTTAGIGNTITYTITDWVPSESAEYYYNNWVINDTISSSLSWGTGDVWITNEYGSNVTGNFTVSKAGNTLSVRSNIVNSASFYGHYYTIHVNTKVTASNLANYTGNGTHLSNAASLTTNRGVNNSNSVSTEIKYSINTSIDHGTITSTMGSVTGNSSPTITFTPTRGYYISKIVVDGVEQNMNNFNILGDSYTFNNVVNNHSIQVYALPKRMRIELSKTDAETGKTAQGDATLAGAKYGIYTEQACTNLVETLTLDANANATSSDLPLVEYINGNYVYHETYYIKETQAPTGYNIDPNVHAITQDAGAQTVAVSVHGEADYTDTVIKNDIEITKYLEKTDSTLKQNLAGVVFKATLNSDQSKVYYSTETNAAGYCKISNLPYGTYTITEMKMPGTAFNGNFYIGASTNRVIMFEQFIGQDKSSGQTYVYRDITNAAKKMQIKVVKEDIETGKITQGDAHLEGAQYTLYKDKDCRNAVETLTIAKQADGTYSATSGWYLVGTYYVKETKAPEGYLIDENVYTVSQVPEQQTGEFSTHTVTSKDEVIRNDIEIIKNLEATDSTEKQSLAGAVFSATLDSDTSKVYYSSVTDENGYCIITELPYGTYTIKESTIPPTAFDGQFYVGNSTTRVKTFKQFIETDSSTNDPYVWGDITDVAEKMQITIYKEDIETGIITQGDARLEDAEYTLYRDEACTDPIETLTIVKNPDGTYSATSSWYLVGTYYIKETKVSEGYLIDEKVYKVEQDPAAQTAEHSYHSITSKNEVIRNDIEVIKNLEATDSTEKQSLPGAVFSATLNSDTSKVYYSSVTDENGYCVITELPYGTYTLRESTLPDVAYNREFYIDDATIRFTTFEQFVEVDNSTNDPYVWGDITDVAEKMQITIYKEDLEKGNNLQGDATLEGAEYTLYRDEACTDAIETITIVKDEDGRFSAKSGWYLVGTYWMKETKAPEGYLIDEKVYKVSQDPAEQTEEHTYHSITSKDQVMKGLVHVIKYNNNSESTDKVPAEGATLMLYLNSNPDKYYLATVDENGYAEFIDEDYRDSQYPYTIPYGRYTIAEVKPSNTGKHIFINKQQTSIEYHHHTQKYVLDDEFVTLRLTIEKYDVETNKKLAAGATFKIWDANANCWYSEMLYPSGEFISEFTTNDQGQLTINRHLESGAYVLYEVAAPEGYVVDEEGYPFFIGVGQNGEVVADHNGEQKTLDYETIKYDNIPTKMYKYTVQYKNMPQKAVVEVTKFASQPVRSEKSETEYGDLYTPIFEEKGLEGVTFRLVAAEDVTTPEGTVRYTKDQIVSTFKTNSEGIGTSDKVYLGKYILEEVSTVNGYVLDRTPVDVNIEYTTQDEEVQTIKVEKINEKQKVNVLFQKEYIDLEQSRFKFTDRKAIFGIYGDFELIDENGEYIIMPGELVDIVEVGEDCVFENNVELPEGEYYVKELYVSNPYGKIDDEFDFKVEYTNTNDTTIDILVNDGVIENEANTAILGMYKFSDLDYINLDIENITDLEEIEELASMYGVAGATYKVYNDAECTDPVITIDNTEAEFTTDENGTIYIEDMPWGTYYFKESVSPFGYELNEEVIKVEINENNADNVIVKKISDRLVRAELLEKRDTFTKDVIEGCAFEITDEEENVIYTGVTDEKGIVEIPVIYFENEGTYYYQEISAPDMYQVNEEKQEFIASYDEETCEWTLELIEVGNDRKTIDEFILVKTDRETGEPLEGCKFTIVLLDQEGKEYVNEYGETIYLVKDAVTAENGEYVIKDVPYGTYKFVEITPPEGYELDEDITGYTFTIDENSG